MAGLNKVMLIGRLTDNPGEPRTMPNGGRVIPFRFAVGRSRKNPQTGQWENDPNPLYIDCEAFSRPDTRRDLVSLIQQYCKKGDPLYLEGRLQYDQWEDKNGDLSQRFTFTDRKGRGSDPGTTTPSMSHNSIMAHSVRGKVAATKEGPRYCVACHLTTEALTNYGTQYDAFRAAMASANYAALDFNFLKDHFGKNTGNQIDSPLWAHMAAGLGTGLFLFDANGAPVNPLDNDVNRKGADGVAPASIYDPARVALNLDRVVTPAGIALLANICRRVDTDGNDPNWRYVSVSE